MVEISMAIVQIWLASVVLLSNKKKKKRRNLGKSMGETRAWGIPKCKVQDL